MLYHSRKLSVRSMGTSTLPAQGPAAYLRKRASTYCINETGGGKQSCINAQSSGDRGMLRCFPEPQRYICLY